MGRYVSKAAEPILFYNVSYNNNNTVNNTTCYASRFESNENRVGC